MAEGIAVCVVAIVEYLVIYMGIFGARPLRVHGGVRLVLFDTAAGAACIFCVLCFHMTAALYIMVLVMSAVNTHELYDLTWSETISSVPVPFAVFAVIAAELTCVFAYYSGGQVQGAQTVCVCAIAAAYWIYLLVYGRKLSGGSGTFPWTGNGYSSALMITAAAFYSAVCYSVMSEAQTAADLRGDLYETAGLYEADALIIVLLTGTAVLVLIFAVIYHFNVECGYRRENERLTEYMDMQRQHFQALLDKEQMTKQFRHDMTAQLTEMKALCDAGDYGRLAAFADEMLGDISSVSRCDYDVGNEAANVILNCYLAPVREKCRIEVKGYAPQSECVSDRDMCIVVSNLVANAAEAVLLLPPDDRFISFSIRSGKIFTYITVKNSYAGHDISEKTGSGSGSAECGNQRLPETSKADTDNHGFGLKNVRSVAARYGGGLECTAKDGVFEAEVRLRNEQPEKARMTERKLV